MSMTNLNRWRSSARTKTSHWSKFAFHLVACKIFDFSGHFSKDPNCLGTLNNKRAMGQSQLTETFRQSSEKFLACIYMEKKIAEPMVRGL